jgi:hypothetical protein
LKQLQDKQGRKNRRDGKWGIERRDERSRGGRNEKGGRAKSKGRVKRRIR